MPVRTFKIFLVQIALFGPILPAMAQGAPAGSTSGTVLDMPATTASASREALQLPPRGTTMARVVERYGPPVERHAPVGQPPITRWDYPAYRLYFENDRVLHAVVPGDPVPVVHEAELISGTRE